MPASKTPPAAPNDPALMERRLERERQSRIAAEALLEAKSSELFTAAERLRAQSERSQALASAIEASSDGVAMADQDGHFIYMNHAHAEMFGHTVVELMGRKWSCLYDEAAAQFLEEFALPVLFADGSWKGETVGRSKSGDPVLQDISLSATPDGGLICTSRDISVRLKKEREIRRLEDRLLEAEREAAMFTVGNAIAHDFNNLIAAITGNALLMQDDLPAEDPSQSYIDRILNATEQAAAVVSTLSPRQQDKPVSVDTIDLVQLVRTGIAISDAIRPANITVQTDLPETALVKGNEVLVSRAVINVIKNAYEAMPSVGNLTVRICAERHALPADEVASYELRRCTAPPLFFLEISDTGAGIAKTAMADIFTPYSTSKTKSKGTGLGLLSLQFLVDNQLADIEVESATGVGTCFRLVFPQPSNRPLPHDTLPISAPIDHPGARLLVVEDDESVGEMLYEVLQRMGFEVTWEIDAPTALQMALVDIRAYDLVLTDLQMPGLSGIELTQRLKAAHPHIPVILYSGQADYIPKDNMFTDILTKPISPDRLRDSIADALAI